MMGLQNLMILSAALVAVSVAPAAAITTVHLSSDAEMLTFLSDTLFVGEGRIGDGLGHATFELDLGRFTSSPEVTCQFDWQNGVTVPWTLTYNYMTNEVVFTAGDSVLYWVSELTGFTDIFVRTRAVQAESHILVENLILDSEAINDSSYSVGGDGLDILWIQAASVFDGFTMSGETTMTWGPVRPSQSQLAFQIKVGKTKPTAAQPTTWGAIKSLYH